ncbi:transposable element Tcb1 transposase [Trichonephila clavipes]|nr:transposable element Tcb1 transposase [Trichonephila clavipes]
MRICDRWMQEGMMDRRGRSHPPQCTTSRVDRQIVLSACTIRRRVQQSGLSVRRPLFGLPLKQNHRRLHHQWYDERRIRSRKEKQHLEHCLKEKLCSEFLVRKVLCKVEVCSEDPVMPRIRSAYQQMQEFETRRIVAY